MRGPDCTARVTSPAPREVWDEICDADPLAGPTQLPAWLDCMCRADGWADSSRLYEMPGGRRLVLPLVRKTVVPTPGDAKPLSIQASFPHGWGLGGILAPGGTTMADAALVLADLADTPGLRTTIRPGFVAAPAWGDAWSRDWAGRRRGARETTQVTHVLDLGGGIEKVWSTRMSSKARTGIRNARRQADKAGLQIEVGSSSRFRRRLIRRLPAVAGLASTGTADATRDRAMEGDASPTHTPVPNRRNGVRGAMPHLGRVTSAESRSPRGSPSFTERSPSVGVPQATATSFVRCGWTSICSSLPSSMRARSAASISIWVNREEPPGSPISRIDLEPPNTPPPSTPSNGCRYPVSKLALSTCGGVSRGVHWRGTGLNAGRRRDECSAGADRSAVHCGQTRGVVATAIRDREWLDAYLLTAGLNQMVEDRLHPDPFQLSQVADFLQARGTRAARIAGALLGRTAHVVGPIAVGRQVRSLWRLRDSLTKAAIRLGGAVLDPQNHAPVLPAEFDAALSAARQLDANVLCVPSCFRSFDQHPDDCAELVRRFLENADTSQPVCVVGVRTSGSYLAPLCAAALEAHGVAAVSVLTYRPGRSWRRAEAKLARDIVRRGRNVSGHRRSAGHRKGCGSGRSGHRKPRRT